MKQSDVAWAAGFFDGEGHIEIWRHRRTHGVRVSAAQAEPHREPLEFLQGLWGGYISETKSRIGRPVYYWGINQNVAAKALSDMLPYLRVKQEEALLALEMHFKQCSLRENRGYYVDTEEFLTMQAYKEQIEEMRRWYRPDGSYGVRGKSKPPVPIA